MTPAWRISASKATIRRLHGQLHGFFRKRVAPSVDVEDLVNTTWLEAGRSFGHRCSLRHYLFFIATRLLWTRARHPTRLVLDGCDFDELPAALRGLSSAVLLNEWQAKAQAAAAQVQDPFDAVVRLWLDGVEPIEIARELGLKYNTTRSRLRRGKEQFYAALQ